MIRSKINKQLTQFSGLLALGFLLALSPSLAAEIPACVSSPDFFTNPTSHMLWQLPTQVLAQDSLAFGTIGDWGGMGSGKKRFEQQLASLATAMNEVAESSDWDFVMNVGDNFYPHGVASIDDARWQVGFENLFDGEKLRSIYWYSVLGNHDFHPPAQPIAQIAYSYLKPYTRWCMPHFFYTYRYQLADFGASFIAIDSNSLLHACKRGCQTKTPSTCKIERERPDPVCSEDYAPQYDAQIQFLDSEIRKAKAAGDWVIVFMHHPIASAGGNYGFKEGPNWGYPVLRDQIASILTHHNIDALFTGHEHLSEFILALPHQIPLVITGNAGYGNGKMACSAGPDCNAKLDLQYGYYKYDAKFVSKSAGFGDIVLTKHTMTFKILGADKTELFTYTREKTLR